MEPYKDFEYDPNKAKNNRKTHKVSFQEATTVFSSSDIIESDDAHSQNEERYRITGYSNRGRLLVVTFTHRKDKIRIISARKANKSDEKNYYEYFK